MGFLWPNWYLHLTWDYCNKVIWLRFLSHQIGKKLFIVYNWLLLILRVATVTIISLFIHIYFIGEYWEEVINERIRNPYSILLVDKNPYSIMPKALGFQCGNTLILRALQFFLKKFLLLLEILCCDHAKYATWCSFYAFADGKYLFLHQSLCNSCCTWFWRLFSFLSHTGTIMNVDRLIMSWLICTQFFINFTKSYLCLFKKSSKMESIINCSSTQVEAILFKWLMQFYYA